MLSLSILNESIRHALVSNKNKSTAPHLSRKGIHEERQTVCYGHGHGINDFHASLSLCTATVNKKAYPENDDTTVVKNLSLILLH